MERTPSNKYGKKAGTNNARSSSSHKYREVSVTDLCTDTNGNRLEDMFDSPTTNSHMETLTAYKNRLNRNKVIQAPSTNQRKMYCPARKRLIFTSDQNQVNKIHTRTFLTEPSKLPKPSTSQSAPSGRHHSRRKLFGPDEAADVDVEGNEIPYQVKKSPKLKSPHENDEFLQAKESVRNVMSPELSVCLPENLHQSYSFVDDLNSPQRFYFISNTLNVQQRAIKRSNNLADETDSEVEDNQTRTLLQSYFAPRPRRRVSIYQNSVSEHCPIRRRLTFEGDNDNYEESSETTATCRTHLISSSTSTAESTRQVRRRLFSVNETSDGDDSDDEDDYSYFYYLNDSPQKQSSCIISSKFVSPDSPLTCVNKNYISIDRNSDHYDNAVSDIISSWCKHFSCDSDCDDNRNSDSPNQFYHNNDSTNQCNCYIHSPNECSHENIKEPNVTILLDVTELTTLLAIMKTEHTDNNEHIKRQHN